MGVKGEEREGMKDRMVKVKEREEKGNERKRER